MNMLVAIESPSSAVARRDASMNSVASRPVASLTALASASVGNSASGLRRKSPVMLWAVLMIARECALLQLRQRIEARRDHDVAAEQHPRPAGGDAHGVDVFRALGDADMAEDRAALLREAGHVEHRAALALDMRGHADERADGHDAGAADAGDQDAVGLVDRRQGGLGQRRQRVRPGAACAS